MTRFPTVMVLLAFLACAEGAPGPTLEIRMVTDQAEATLAVLDRIRAGATPDSAAWETVFASEGFRRLQAREHAMGRAFDASLFRVFATTDTVAARAPRLAETLQLWATADLNAAAARAGAYLPPETVLRAAVYLLIKPAPNSFVFGLPDDPGIFLYLDPDLPPAMFENMVAHELHHIGLGTACGEDLPPPSPEAGVVRRWLGAFGEGLAMLAAAGGPEVHPHATSAAEDRERWDRDIQRVDEDLRELDDFFRAILDGRISEDSATIRARTYYGVQGPWYTVGWTMAATVERAFGRERLVAVVCDPVALLRLFNQATRGATWSADLLAAL